MIEPNERLKRIFEFTNESLTDHAEKKSEARLSLEDAVVPIDETTRDVMNFYYHEGYLDAIRKIRSLFRMWDGTKEEWFKLVKDDGES